MFKAKKKLLIVVNPVATTVSEKTKRLVGYALKSVYDIEMIETKHQLHAQEISVSVDIQNFDAVASFGGDGTVNEVVNGLANTGIPLIILPGGSTNVACRALGLPHEIVEATERILEMRGNFNPRTVDLGLANDRYFLFGSGIGIDADAMRRIESRPQIKWNLGKLPYVYSMFYSYFLKYACRKAGLKILFEEGEKEATTAVVQNLSPYSYFAGRAIMVAEDLVPDSGTLSLSALPKAKLAYVPSVLRNLATSTPLSHANEIIHMPNLKEVKIISSSSGKPFPVHVDGEDLGDHQEIHYQIAPAAITVI